MSSQSSGNSNVRLTPVEKIAIQASRFDVIYPPTEKIPVVVVDNFPALGKLAAMRFIEWVQHNPDGVIALPTGKTPEYFIKWIRRILADWYEPKLQSILESAGIDPSDKPDMKGLHFVQIDEFYPIDSMQHNSFNHYVKHFYIDGFGLDPDKALLIDPSAIGLQPNETLTDIWPDKSVDLNLRHRKPKTKLEQRQKDLLEKVDQWCMEYEQRIRNLGGIGFFLGGIGPDGHIGFNIKGSDHNTTTRLCPINYETQAAAATDLGGIEIARKCLVITIGLRTITRNPDCTAIVIAAGEAKAHLVAQAVQSIGHINIPASGLRQLSNARFYITRGATGQLIERQIKLIQTSNTLTDAEVENILVNLAVKQNKRLVDLTETDARSDRLASTIFQQRSELLAELAKMTQSAIIAKIENGMRVYKNKCFLHTEPHHDDIMLGYFAHIIRHFRQHTNTHHFVTLTSGFTSVTNEFMQGQIDNLRRFLATNEFKNLINEGYFAHDNITDRNRDVWQYLDGVAAQNEYDKAEGCARRMLRNLTEVFGQSFFPDMFRHIDELENYFATVYPGKKDPQHIQKLKGMVRQWEGECLWGYYGWQCQNVNHLRLSFYTGDIFTKDPTMDKDVPTIARLFKKIDPDILTVAFDPEASGPDTHYKVMQALAEALRIHIEQSRKSDIKILGYRNVWFRFEPSEVNMFVPVTLAMFSIAHDAFMNSFITQKNASFPSYEYDGPFSQLAQNIQVEQYRKVKIALGREWFYNHPSGLIRATRGFVFLNEMTPDQFFNSCRKLRKSVENI